MTRAKVTLHMHNMTIAVKNVSFYRNYCWSATGKDMIRLVMTIVEKSRRRRSWINGRIMKKALINYDDDEKDDDEKRGRAKERREDMNNSHVTRQR